MSVDPKPSLELTTLVCHHFHSRATSVNDVSLTLLSLLSFCEGLPQLQCLWKTVHCCDDEHPLMISRANAHSSAVFEHCDSNLVVITLMSS